MSTVPADIDGPSDAELIESVRSGTVASYGPLYERHVGAARNLARQLTRSPAEADDLVSEAFAKVLDTLRQGRGPDSAFRAYLLTALRHTAYDKTRRDRKVELSDDVSQVRGVNPDAVSVPFADTAVAGLERTLAARAFALLPERWQAVLWHTEIEGQSPAQVAPLLGLSPNGVSALAYRAREGLRQAYLQVHLAESTADRCRSTADRLGAWVRGGLSKRETAQVEAHLDDCERCRALAAELADINGGLRAVVAPLVLGLGATAGYLAAAKAAAGTTAVVATAAAASTGGAAGALAGAPRQFLGVAASGVALAAAVAVGLASSPSGQQIPAAAAPVPTSQAPAPPAPQAPPPAPPAPAAPEPPAPSVTEPRPVPEPPQPPPAPEPTPTPGPPALSADGPATPVALIPGGGPADLPITVRNTGSSVSQPVSAALALPPGVSAVPAGPTRLAGEPMLRLNGRAQTGTVFCPGGTGTVTCATTDGLRPGDSATLLFRLVASPGAGGGQITGTVSAGTTISVRVSLPVKVLPPPTVDGVDVLAVTDPGDWFRRLLPWPRDVRVLAQTINTGTSTKPITVTTDVGGTLLYSTAPVSCTASATAVSCRTTAPVAPGTRVDVVFLVGRSYHWSPGLGTRKVTVTVALGTAVDSASVKVPWWPGLWWPGLAPEVPTSPPPVPSTAVKPPPTKPTTTTTTTARPVPLPTSTVPPTAPPSTEPGTQPTPICSGKDRGGTKRWDLPC
ncbi:sigma-70 family RNA polymerase sigma factor [Actinokineospora sp.]|uniref:sigma-70 family RNA polymerase sigma factor n=1 Tax=Actinokineospora sp. TaxID=1872133 RepID=UPI004037A2DB